MESSLTEIQLSGISMYPALQEGDLCFIAKDRPCYGDIVCLRNTKTKEFVIHRLHDTQKKITKGDNSLYWDDPSEHVFIGTIKKFRRENITSQLIPHHSYALLSRYTTITTPKIIRLFAKSLMRVI